MIFCFLLFFPSWAEEDRKKSDKFVLESCKKIKKLFVNLARSEHKGHQELSHPSLSLAAKFALVLCLNFVLSVAIQALHFKQRAGEISCAGEQSLARDRFRFFLL